MEKKEEREISTGRGDEGESCMASVSEIFAEKNVMRTTDVREHAL